MNKAKQIKKLLKRQEKQKQKIIFNIVDLVSEPHELEEMTAEQIARLYRCTRAHTKTTYKINRLRGKQ